MEQPAESIRFGPFTLHRRRREVVNENAEVVIRGRGFDLLAALLERPGQLLSRHQLFDLVWPGVIVEDNNLHVQMATLRRALGPHQGWVQTVPGRGYRFIGDIAPEGETPQPPEPAAPIQRTLHNLPVEQGDLIGRVAELAALRELLGERRLVTLVGPSGIGKTHLSLAVGHAALADFPGGVRLIELAPLGDERLVEGAVAAAFDLRLPPGGSAVEAVADAVTKPTLLILDNAEHLIGAVAAFTRALLRRCAGIRVLATSLEPLRIDAETVYRLDPPTLPPSGTRDAAEVLRYGAAALFVERVKAVDRHFRMSGDNAMHVVTICRSLDGIPLALEMAAARVPAMGLEGLQARLGERLHLLNLGRRTAEARHRTLRATMTWTYDLLDERERAVFRRLGVFAGGFSVEAMAAVFGDGSDAWELVDALGRLVDKSLVVAEPVEPPRYRLLETPRFYAIEQLQAQGEYDDYASRHARFFDGWLTRAYDGWEETADTVWLAAAAPELDNVRAALNWALDGKDAELVVSVAGAAALLWDKLSLLVEGRRSLERAEAAITAATSAPAAARLYRQIGNIWFSSDRPRALAALERAEALYRELGDTANLGAVLALLGLIRNHLGAKAAAAQTLNAARIILEGSGRRKSLFNVINNLGVMAVIHGETETAQDLFEQALAVTRRSPAMYEEVLVLINLGEVAFTLGRIEEAVARSREAAARLRGSGRHADLGWTLVNLASYLLIAGDTAAAALAAREALLLVRPVGGFILRVCLQQWALLAAVAGDFDGAARLTGFVDAGYAAAGETREPTEARIYDSLLEKLAAGLSVAARTALLAEGGGLPERDAAALAIANAALFESDGSAGR